MAGQPAILKRVKDAPLFQHVGEEMDADGVKAVRDWPACMAGIEGNKWINIGTMIFNRIFAAADAARGSAWMGKHWNALVVARNATLVKVVEPAAKPLIRKHKLSARFQWTVVGHLLQAWFLSEYDDEPAAAWSNRLLDWYLAGHVPCGYSGAVPSGKSTDAMRLPDLAKGKLLVF